MGTCKEVYVAGFENHPGLVKIGKAAISRRRLNKLEGVHGRLIFAEFANFGDESGKIERSLHRRFKTKQVVVRGDGGTEFFDISVKDAAIASLSEKSGVCVSELEVNLQNAEERCSSFICRTFNNRELGLFDFGVGSLWALHLSVDAATGLGFNKLDALSLAASKVSKIRFITPKRLELLLTIAPDYRLSSRYKAAYEAYHGACDKLGISNKERYSSRHDYYMPNNWYNY